MLANLQVVLVAVAAWLLLGEKPSAQVAIAVPLVFGGAVLISGVVGDEPFGDDPARGALFGVLTGVAYTGFILVLRDMGRDLRRPAGPLFAATFVATLVAIAAGAALGELDLAPSWPAHGWLVDARADLAGPRLAAHRARAAAAAGLADLGRAHGAARRLGAARASCCSARTPRRCSSPASRSSSRGIVVATRRARERQRLSAGSNGDDRLQLRSA